MHADTTDRFLPIAREWLERVDLYDHDPSFGPDGEPDAPRGEYDALSLANLIESIVVAEKKASEPV